MMIEMFSILMVVVEDVKLKMAIIANQIFS